MSQKIFILVLLFLFCGDALADCPPGYTTCDDGGCCSPDYPVCCWGDREGTCGVDRAACSLPGKDDDVDVGCWTGVGSHGRSFSWLLVVMPLLCALVVCKRYLFKR